jgi:hypothetical protein
LTRGKCDICNQEISIPHKWTFYFLMAVGFWNFLGAGIFGFLIGVLMGGLVGATLAILLAPSSGEALRQAIRHAGAVAVLDKALSFGYQGVLATDVRAALYEAQQRPLVLGLMAGFGGREVNAERGSRLVTTAQTTGPRARSVKAASAMRMRTRFR